MARRSNKLRPLERVEMTGSPKHLPQKSTLAESLVESSPMAIFLQQEKSAGGSHERPATGIKA
jgi:hypothetical protein